MMGLREKLSIPLLGKARRFAAVDFDSCRVRLVLAEMTSGGTRIGNIASLALPDDVEAADPEALGRFLAQALKDMGFRGAGMVMNVPRSQAVLKPLSLPPGTLADELPAMVYFQVEKELPFPPEDAVIDFVTEPARPGQPTEPDEQESQVAQELNVLVAAIRLSVVDYYRRIAEAADLKLLGLGLRPHANMRCVEAGQPSAKRDSLAVVQITADETEIDFMAHGSLVFSRSAVKNMSAVSGLDRATVREAVGAVATEVALSLQSYQAIERGAQVSSVLLAGETGLESQAAETLASRLGVPCEMFQPDRAFADQGRAHVPSAFISALGMAIGHPGDRDTSLDFINPKRPPLERDPRKVRAIAAAVGLAVLLIAAVGTRAVIIGGKEKRVGALLKRDKELKSAIQAAKATALRVDAMENWREGSCDWLAQWAHLSCLLPSAKDVYLTSLSSSPDGTITLKVQAATTEAITSLNQQLEKAGYKFKPGQTKTGTDKYGYRYSTTLRVLASATAKADLATTRPVSRPEDDSTPEQFVRKSNPPRRPTRTPTRGAALRPQRTAPRRRTSRSSRSRR